MATLAVMEKKAILFEVKRVKGDKLKAASNLGIGKTTLYRKLNEYAGKKQPQRYVNAAARKRKRVA